MTIALMFADPAFACPAADRACVRAQIATESAGIDNPAWRDQTWRELAKTTAFDGDTDGAIAMIPKISNPDTQAMTIRGIGMAAARLKLPPEQYDPLFIKLKQAADAIKDPPSHAIALTYIAMAQAFAGLDDAARETARGMENDALRHKAYGETAEIEAERGDAAAAMKSVELIDSASYRGKALMKAAKTLADKKLFDDALRFAQDIKDPYEKTSTLQYILDAQKPREVEKE